MADYGGTVGGAATGYTSAQNYARPWAVTCVFKVDGNSSNQHIWNQGEGAGGNDDNIFLRIDAARYLYFGWGRSGGINEVRIGQLSTSNWYGLYVSHDGERQSAPSASSLADMFDIRLYNSANGWTSFTQHSTSSDWGGTYGSTGERMDRNVGGKFSIGGRESNRNFHGKVASCVVTTLKRGVVLPTDVEATVMTIDPMQWATDYKVGKTYRATGSSGQSGVWSIGNGPSDRSTQIWLMGDGTGDAFSTIKNQVNNTNIYTKLDMTNMVSNDIETVNIPGLTD